MPRVKSTNEFKSVPANGITINELSEALLKQRETIRAILKHKAIPPIGYVKIKITKANVYDKKDVEFLYTYVFKTRVVTEKKKLIDNKVRLFLNRPMPEGYSWNYWR